MFSWVELSILFVLFFCGPLISFYLFCQNVQRHLNGNFCQFLLRVDSGDYNSMDKNEQLRLLCCQFVWNTVPLSRYILKYLYWTNPCSDVFFFVVFFLFSVSPVVFLAAVMLAHFCSNRSTAVNMYIIISYVSSDLHHMSTVFLFFIGKRQDVIVLVPLVHFF